jgi:hypothetical protein
MFGGLLLATQPADAETIGLRCTSKTGSETRDYTVDLAARTVSWGGGDPIRSPKFVFPAQITAASIDFSIIINGGNYAEDNHIDRSTGFMTSAQHNIARHLEEAWHFQCQKTQGF